MHRPYVIYHMLTTIDQKVTGHFLTKQETRVLHDAYYCQHRLFRADAFLFGSTAAQQCFCPEEYTLQTPAAPVSREDSIPAGLHGPYAVITQSDLYLAWADGRVHSPISCYDDTQIIVVLTDAVSDGYLHYLRERNIPYLFCGRDTLDYALLLDKLADRLGVSLLLLEGSPWAAGALMQQDLLDELSFIVAPCMQGSEGLPAFSSAAKSKPLDSFVRFSTQTLNGHGMWLRYRKRKPSLDVRYRTEYYA